VGGTRLLLHMDRRAGPRLQRYVTPPVDARGTRVQLQGPPGWKLSPFPHRGISDEPTTAAFRLTPGDPLAAWPVWLRRWVRRPWVPKVEERATLFVAVGPLSTTPRPWLYDGKIRATHFPRSISEPAHLPPRVYYAQRGVSSPDRRYWLRVSYHRENETAFEGTYRPICNSLRFLEPVP
jgi:hypothetical protein